MFFRLLGRKERGTVTGRPARFAVLWDVDLDESAPVGLAVERSNHVRVYLPRDSGVPTRYDGEYRVFGPDGSDIVYRPGDDGYFEQVLVDLSRVFAIGTQDVREDLHERAAIMELFLTYVVHPRTDRVAGEYEVEPSRQASRAPVRPTYTGNGSAARHAKPTRRLLPRAA